MNYAAYNTSAEFTSQGEQDKSFVLMSTHFKSPANVSWIEFVPMSKGDLHIDVIIIFFIYFYSALNLSNIFCLY